MQMQAKTQAGYKLLHEGVTALAAVEANGIRIDQKYLKRIKKQLRHQIEDITVELKTGKEHKDVYRQWQRRYGSNANLGSRTQFGKVLFDDLKLPKPPPKERDRDDEKEETGNYDMAREALEGLDLPFVGRWLELEKLKKTLNTYLRGIERETTPDGFLHPSFDLLFARTFRSSSSAPNFQNMPIRVQLAQLPDPMPT